MKTMGIIFSNIHDANLGELTKQRTIGSLPFGGRYRLIDFALSNMVNSNIVEVGVITKSNYQSLMDHLSNVSNWDLDRKNGSLFILPPFAMGQSNVYASKIDALYGAIAFIENSKRDYVVLSDTNVLCNIELESVVEQHVASGADITVVGNQENNSDDYDELVLTTEPDKNSATDIAVGVKAGENSYNGMGIYVIKRDFLIKVVRESVAHGYTNFEKDFLQRQYMMGKLKIGVYKFGGVVLRNCDVLAYYNNNMRLFDKAVRDDLFNPKRPIYTKVYDSSPAYYGKNAVVNDCVIASGCKIDGLVENSVIFRDVQIPKGCVVRNSIIMQGTKLDENVNLDHAIIDKQCKISANRSLMGAAVSPLIIRKGEVI